MTRVGLARTGGGYGELRAPYPPGDPFPELEAASVRPSSRPNPTYRAVREALLGLGLDAARAGTPHWNPLGDLVHAGGSVVLKPNFIRHWNPAEGRGGSLDSVITHGAVVRAMADYASLAVGPSGSVVVAEAPQQDCSFDAIRRAAGLDALIADFEEQGRRLQVIDLRREEVRFRDGIVVERTPLPGDPAGYRSVDLGERSFFSGSGLDPMRFRGADYDPGPTVDHHVGGRNAYLLSETVLSCDLIVNLPKLKTHKKTGVTLALKNMVGINGDKNWLPHHTLGSPAEGGDEYPGRRLIDRLRSRATELARPLLSRGRAVGLLRTARRLERAARGDDFVRSGNWSGNQTTWRMCADLNRCVYYSDADGFHPEAAGPVRTVLTLIDGIVAGEGEGPLAPTDRPLGVVIAATDPVAADLVAIRLMGFDERRIPKVWETMRATELRVTGVGKPGDVEVVERRDGGEALRRTLDDLHCERPFAAHPGWRDQIERRAA